MMEQVSFGRQNRTLELVGVKVRSDRLSQAQIAVCFREVCHEEHKTFFTPLREQRFSPNTGATMDDAAGAEAGGGVLGLHAGPGSASEGALLGLGAGTRTGNNEGSGLDSAAEVGKQAETTAANNLENTCFQGLKPFCPGLRGFNSSADTERVLSPVRRRVSVFRPMVSTFLNVCDTCSPMALFRRHADVLLPLMSQLCLDDATWWLLDSGASATVIAEMPRCMGFQLVVLGMEMISFVLPTGLRSA